MDRRTILEGAISATCGDRDAAYGSPYIQLGLAGELKELIHKKYDAHGSRPISPAEWEATEQELTKIARRILGPKVTLDSYLDSAAYAAIAGEAALIYQEEQNNG